MIEDFSGQVLAEKYRIDSVWRETPAGKLYRATHLLMDKPVVVKILSPSLARDPENVRRFAQEARTVSHLSHPNILNVTDYGSDKSGTHFIVLENAARETLKETVSREGKLPVERAVRIARQIAAGLSAAATGGVIHTNLTSENVLLADENSDIVKIFGFGAPDADERAVFDDNFSGRAAYFAPEQFSSGTGIDERTNVYNLGVILFEMLAGEVPFVGEKPTDVILKHEQEPPPPLSAFRKDLPDDISRVILSAMAKNPDLRYQSARDFADALDRVTPVSSISTNARALAATGGTGIDDGAQNNIWKTAFIVLAGIAVLGTFFIYLTQVKQTDPVTTLPTDANGQPVQPASPATGTGEQMLSNMSTFAPDAFGNSNTTLPQPDVLPGGDGFDPWARGVPPAGAPNSGVPYPVQPGGQQVYIDPNGGSVFMPRDDGTFVEMVPKTSNSNANVNTQTAPKNRQTTAPNTNTQTNSAAPAPTPAANTATPKATPAAKPTAAPPKPTATPSANEKRAPSGKEQDS